jgi:hypothetical protein
MAMGANQIFFFFVPSQMTEIDVNSSQWPNRNPPDFSDLGDVPKQEFSRVYMANMIASSLAFFSVNRFALKTLPDNWAIVLGLAFPLLLGDRTNGMIYSNYARLVHLDLWGDYSVARRRRLNPDVQ